METRTTKTPTRQCFPDRPWQLSDCGEKACFILPLSRHLGTNWRSCGINCQGFTHTKPCCGRYQSWLGEGSEPAIWASLATKSRTISPSRLQRASIATGRARKKERTRAHSVWAGPRTEHRRATRGLTPTSCARETGREPGETSTPGDGKTVSVVLFSAHHLSKPSPTNQLCLLALCTNCRRRR